MSEHVNWRGNQITRDDIISAMEQFDRDGRASFPERQWVRFAIEHNGKLYPPKETMRIATRVPDVPGGGEPINRLFRDLGFRVVNILDVEPDQNQAGAYEETSPASLSLERDLESALCRNLDQLEAGLRLYDVNGRNGRQLDTQAVGRIDLLVVDRVNNLLVIELKVGEADDIVCGQLLRYMGWVMEKLAGKRTVRGMIVASEFSQRLKYAARAMTDVSLKAYEVNFKFTDAM